MTIDGEVLLDDLFGIVSAALNTKIVAIEAEKIAMGKGVTPTLAQVLSTSYFRQTWNDKILNANPAIFYGIEDTASVDGGGGTGVEYQIWFDVVLVDNGMTNDYDRRIHRYSRALKEILEENVSSLGYCSRLKIKAVRPQSWKLELDSSEEIKVGGVAMTVAIY